MGKKGAKTKGVNQFEPLSPVQELYNAAISATQPGRLNNIEGCSAAMLALNALKENKKELLTTDQEKEIKKRTTDVGNKLVAFAKKAPVKMKVETPVEVKVDTSVDTSVETPVEVKVDTSVDTSVETPVEMKVEELVVENKEEKTAEVSPPSMDLTAEGSSLATESRAGVEAVSASTPLKSEKQEKSPAMKSQERIDELMIEFYDIVGKLSALSVGKGYSKSHDDAIDTLMDSLKTHAQTFWQAPSDRAFVQFNNDCRAAITIAEKALVNEPGVWRNLLNGLINALDSIMKFIHVRDKNYQPGLFKAPESQAETDWKNSRVREQLLGSAPENGADGYFRTGVLDEIDETPKPTGRQ